MKTSVKEIVTIVLVVLIVFNALLTQMILGDKGWSATVVAGCLLLFGIMALLFLGRNSLSFEFNKPLIVLQEIVALGFVGNGIYFHVLGYIVIGMIFAIIVPVSNLIFVNSKVNIIQLMSKGIVITFPIIAFVSVLIGPPLTIRQYSAILNNANSLGYYIVIVVSATIFLIITRKNNITYKIILGFALAVAFIVASRTAATAILLQLIIVSALYIIEKIRDGGISELGDIIKRAVLFFVIFILCIFITFGLLTSCKMVIQKTIPEIQLEYKHAPLQELSNLFNISNSRFGKGLGEGDTLEEDELTSGRIEIWKQFGQNIHLIGHASENREIVENNRYYPATNAHNVYIQVAYSAGIISGIAMLLFAVLMCIFIVRNIIKKIIAREPIPADIIFVGCICVGFVISSLTSSGYMIFTYPIATFYWLSSYYIINNR